MRKFVVGLAALLACASSGAAQTSLGGFVEYDHLTYLETPDEDEVNGRNAGTLQLEVDHTVNETASMFGAFELRADLSDPSRNRVYLDEAYLDLYVGAFDLRIGKQIYVWGKGDGLNPTDNLAVWDYSDVLDTDDERIGQVSIRSDYYFGNWTLEGVLIPSFTASVLPGVDSRWFPPVPEGLSVSFAEPDAPDEGVESFQYATRLSGSSGGWDYSMSWFDGYDDLPAVRVDTTESAGASPSELRFRYSYNRRRAIGADFATTFGSMGVHGEAAYFITEDWEGTDPAIDDPYLQYVLGIDHTFRDVLPGRNLFLIVEWAHDVPIPDRGGSHGTFDLNHVFRESVLARAGLDLGEFMTLSMSGAVNLDPDGWWLQPEFWWSAADALEISVRAEVLGGADDSFFGIFRDNRRVQARVRYSF